MVIIMLCFLQCGVDHQGTHTWWPSHARSSSIPQRQPQMSFPIEERWYGQKLWAWTRASWPVHCWRISLKRCVSTCDCSFCYPTKASISTAVNAFTSFLFLVSLIARTHWKWNKASQPIGPAVCKKDESIVWRIVCKNSLAVSEPLSRVTSTLCTDFWRCVIAQYQTGTLKCVVDPFCGEGTVLAVANQMGLDSLGVERSYKRCKKAAQFSGVALA